jgi:hypothetical protein
MPDLPPSLYVPAVIALAAVISALAGATAYCLKWARESIDRLAVSEREKDAIQEKWITYQEKEIPLKQEQLRLTVRLVDLLGGN